MIVIIIIILIENRNNSDNFAIGMKRNFRFKINSADWISFGGVGIARRFRALVAATAASCGVDDGGAACVDAARDFEHGVLRDLLRDGMQIRDGELRARRRSEVDEGRRRHQLGNTGFIGLNIIFI